MIFLHFEEGVCVFPFEKTINKLVEKFNKSTQTCDIYMV